MDHQQAPDDGVVPAPPHVHWISPPKLPRFSGELCDGPVEDFIREAERVLAAYQLQDGMAAEYVLRHLDGLARREVLALPATNRGTADAVLAALQDAFGDTRAAMTLLSAFHSRQQRSAERLLEYIHSLQELAAKINARQAGTISDQALRDRFVEGLANPALKRELRRMIRDDATVTLLALRAEATEWLRHEPPEDILVQRQQPTELTNVKHLEEQVSALTSTLQAMQTTILTLSEQVQKQNSASIYPTGQIKSRPPFKGKCYNCKQLGHLARNCPKPRSRHSQQPGNV
ncbi:hypothetical protein BaRGS_00035658 [Batillaria attramentaria]